MSLRFKSTGVFSSLQDKGRVGGSALGIPGSGAMDMEAFRLANSILGNPADAACIEFYRQGLEVEFSQKTCICLVAIDAALSLNQKPVHLNSVIKIKPGDVLKVERTNDGNWGYLAVKQGFSSEEILGSKSFYPPLTLRRFSSQDKVEYQAFDGEIEEYASNLGFSRPFASSLKVYKGPEFDQLSETLRYQLFEASFSLSTSQTRMAYSLHERLDNELEEMTTGPVLPGTVQYTPHGKMIVLMRDAQVTGGYPRILQLTEASINQLAQMRPKSKINFQLIEINSEKT